MSQNTFTDPTSIVANNKTQDVEMKQAKSKQPKLPKEKTRIQAQRSVRLTPISERKPQQQSSTQPKKMPQQEPEVSADPYHAIKM